MSKLKALAPKRMQKEATFLAALTLAQIIYGQYQAGGLAALDIQIVGSFVGMLYVFALRLKEKFDGVKDA